MGNCWVVDQFCESPITFPSEESLEYNVRTKCYACGGSVCKFCSLIVIYYGKRCRICHNCISDQTKSNLIPMEHLYELAGYPTKLERPIIVR